MWWPRQHPGLKNILHASADRGGQPGEPPGGADPARAATISLVQRPLTRQVCSLGSTFPPAAQPAAAGTRQGTEAQEPQQGPFTTSRLGAGAEGQGQVHQVFGPGQVPA